MIQGSVGRESVAKTFRVLRKFDPDSVRELRKELQGQLKPVAKAIAAKYPSQAYLSGLEGRTRVSFRDGGIVVKENWKWSEVVSKVSITPGKSRNQYMSQFDARYIMPFADRHIGPRKEDLAAMLSVIGVNSLDELIDKIVPSNMASTV